MLITKKVVNQMMESIHPSHNVDTQALEDIEDIVTKSLKQILDRADTLTEDDLTPSDFSEAIMDVYPAASKEILENMDSAIGAKWAVINNNIAKKFVNYSESDLKISPKVMTYIAAYIETVMGEILELAGNDSYPSLSIEPENVRNALEKGTMLPSILLNIATFTGSSKSLTKKVPAKAKVQTKAKPKPKSPSKNKAKALSSKNQGIINKYANMMIDEVTADLLGPWVLDAARSTILEKYKGILKEVGFTYEEVESNILSHIDPDTYESVTGETYDESDIRSIWPYLGKFSGIDFIPLDFLHIMLARGDITLNAFESKIYEILTDYVEALRDID